MKINLFNCKISQSILVIFIMIAIPLNAQNFKSPVTFQSKKIEPSTRHFLHERTIYKNDQSKSISNLNIRSQWIISILPSTNAIGTCFLESYDKGYLQSGWLGNYYYPASYIVKTNINGNMLWNKTLVVDGITGFSADAMAQTNDGSIYICGGMDEGLSLDGFILKLNSCGEREWIKRFYTPQGYDWAWHVLAEPDGGCTVMILNQDDYQGNANRMQLVRFTSEGNMLWNQYLINNDTLAKGSTIESIIRAKDSSYILCGDIYYRSNIDPQLFYLHPYLLNADINGNLIRSTIFFKESESGGRLFKIANGNTNEFLYLFGSKTTVVTWPGGLVKKPAIFFYNMTNDSIYFKEILHDTLGYLMDAFVINNNLIISSQLDTGGPWYYQFLIKTDTLGDIINTKNITNDIYTVYIRRTFDSKILCLVLESSNTQPGDFNTYLYKYNQDLEFDTLNPNIFVYDSLCPHTISTDTVWCDNPDIIGIEELFPDQAKALKVFPNPTSGLTRIVLPDYTLKQQQLQGFSTTLVQYHTPVHEGLLEVFDSYGRKQQEFITPAGQTEFECNLSTLSTGLYLIRYSTDKGHIGSGRVIISK